jgi:serine protease Do
MDYTSFMKKRGSLFGGTLLICLLCLAATPTAKAQNLQNLRLFQTTDNASGAYLGVSMQDVTAKNLSEYRLAEERGVIVRSVQKGSPAEAASVKEDDVILEFAGQQVLSSFQLSRLVKETPVGRKVALVVSRDGKRLNLNATLEAREPSRADGGIDEQTEPFPLRSPNLPRNFGFRLDTPDRNDNRRQDRQNRQDEDRAQDKPRLGVETQTLTTQMAEYLGVTGKKGALVASVASGSASDGKLKAGDVIVGIDGDSIDNPETLSRAIQGAAAGQVAVKIIRDKKPLSVNVELPAGGNRKSYRL